ncbi:glycosyltransferase [Caballeronia sp. ATUFL_F1_KS4A]|uniref:glycosyltransferase n=1 Tax=Caballeronia sp. ATUFL_F1_KS4A TaxID=2921768 RepID=UPI0020285D73|nr:glycosyltransferase [Caballeronia sp. ATUFL_F1_KS4A]
MKTLKTVFFCIDDIGMTREVGQWLLVSIKSVLTNTSCTPMVLYCGTSEDAMQRLRDAGAKVKACRSRWAAEIEQGRSTRAFPLHMEGALMRYDIAQLECGDEYVMYADCDTYFFRQPQLDLTSVETVGACVTSRTNGNSHFNSGVILFQTSNYLKQSEVFFRFIESTLGNWLPSSVDEMMFNEYFGTSIVELPAEVNWRPFFGFNPNVDVVHFHGFQLTHTIYMLTRDYRGFERSLLDSDYLFEMAIHRASSLIASESYFSEMEQRGAFEGTEIAPLIGQMAQLTDRKTLCRALMLANAQLGRASRETLHLAHLADMPDSDPERTFFALGSVQHTARFHIHPCKSFGAGTMIISDPSGTRGFSLFANEAVDFSRRDFDDRIEVFWSGVGIDCHFLLLPHAASADLGLELASLGRSSPQVFAYSNTGECTEVMPQTVGQTS